MKTLYKMAPAAMQGAGAGAGVPWYLSGGAPDTVAAYQPLGADDLADSYINLANPGTNDAAPGTAPGWAAGTGWQFDGSTSSRYLTTGIIPGVQNYTVIIRYSDAVADTKPVIGSTDGAGVTLQIVPGQSGLNRVIYQYKNQATVTPQLLAGVLAVAGVNCYRNGVADGTIAADASTGYKELYIGARNDNGVAAQFATANVQAVSIYSSILTPAQVAAVSAAMSNLA